MGVLEDGIEHVGWSEDGADGPHLIVMRDFSSDDGYCLVTRGGTFYGGVTSVRVEPGETSFFFSTQAADALDLGTTVAIRYPEQAVDEARLRATLESLIG